MRSTTRSASKHAAVRRPPLRPQAAKHVYAVKVFGTSANYLREFKNSFRRIPPIPRFALFCFCCGFSRSASFASYRSSKVIHRRRGEPGFASPQTTVSNFGGRQKMGCEKLRLLLNPPIEHAGSGRRILRPNVATFSQRLSLRNPAPCRKGMLRTLRLQAETWQRRTSISLSIRQGPRAQSTNLN